MAKIEGRPSPKIWAYGIKLSYFIYNKGSLEIKIVAGFIDDRYVTPFIQRLCHFKVKGPTLEFLDLLQNQNKIENGQGGTFSVIHVLWY